MARGDTKVLSFRVPTAAYEMFEARVGEAEGIANKTEGLQDAMVVWCLLEEALPDASGSDEWLE